MEIEADVMTSVASRLSEDLNHFKRLSDFRATKTTADSTSGRKEAMTMRAGAQKLRSDMSTNLGMLQIPGMLGGGIKRWIGTKIYKYLGG